VISRKSEFVDTVLVSNRPTWNGKVYRQAKFGDISIKGIAKEAELKMRRQRVRRRDYEGDHRALEEFYAARDARLPWPIRAIGAVLDFILRRPSF
jgi:hypothetical protein